MNFVMPFCFRALESGETCPSTGLPLRTYTSESSGDEEIMLRMPLRLYELQRKYSDLWLCHWFHTNSMIEGIPMPKEVALHMSWLLKKDVRNEDDTSLQDQLYHLYCVRRYPRRDPCNASLFVEKKRPELLPLTRKGSCCSCCIVS